MSQLQHDKVIEIQSPISTFRSQYMISRKQINYLQGDEDTHKDLALSSIVIGSNINIERNQEQTPSNNSKIEQNNAQNNEQLNEFLEDVQYDDQKGYQVKSLNKFEEKEDIENQKDRYELQRLSTTAGLLEDEYFGEDSEKKQNKRSKYINPDMFNKLRDHHVDWDYNVFFEIFWYHILNYMLIGPFVTLVYYKKRVLMRNLQFWGNTQAFYIQTTFFIFNVFIITLYFTSSSQNIYLVEIIFTFFIMILRCYIIACKYATLHPDKIKLYRDYVLDVKLTITDYYLTNWKDQDDKTLYRETYNALQRGEFDPSMFYISFFVEPSKQAADEMNELNQNISKHHSYTTVKYQPKCIFPVQQTQYFYGYSVLGYLIRQYSKQNRGSSQILQALILAGIRTAGPIIYRYIYRENFEFRGIEIAQLVALSINTFFGYLFSFVFLFFYIRDMKLKDFMLNQCKLMLQVKKIHLSEKKVLPTVDIINPYSLKGWSILRRICLDYGKQYVLRMQAYLTIYFFSIFITTIILILWVLKIYKLDNIYPIMCLYELIVTFSILLAILYQGCLLNECFEYYKNTLGDHKVLFLDIMRMKNVYFKDQNFVASNFVLKKSLTKIKQILKISDQTKTHDENINDYLNQLMNSISDCENEVDQDFRNQPFTLYGITITLTLFQQLVIALLTVVAGFVQIYLFINNKISTSSL
ncbi:transmembrane protein, putative (macronuclear) [Tetrahymena thermophila SB210]|uniref:Transmembrane protein, putative n=1 Tax=Tetrahymena thermophila (strain SB210) TaxID=312017 RepID=I7MAA2_TETTS|nr:transmembrane protein, putative [Tetrahymena thermophila SB210]EAS03998.2 transmembrane protein, putative [Tetrahymena thermophila SB210]|eukprot:XP_001024243.2 transmembrane protein, putative [Tetrahymena thermophila SB210]